jgi:YidC/Oxa1 family membrane protein insertase
MSPRIRRLLITIAVLAIAGSVVLVSFLGPGRRAAPAPAAAPGVSAPPPAQTAAAPPADAVPPEAQLLEGLKGDWVVEEAIQPLGALDPGVAALYLEFDPVGAGLARITLSHFWLSAADGRRAAAHYQALARGQPGSGLPPDQQRYVLQGAQTVTVLDPQRGPVNVSVPLLAADTIEIDDKPVRLIYDKVENGVRSTQWRQTAPGAFEATISDESGRPVARVSRVWTLGQGYDIALRQGVENLTGGTLRVRWVQRGPGDIVEERTSYLDARRLRFGYLPDAAAHPGLVAAGTGDLLIERRAAIKRAEKASAAAEPARRAELLQLWPDETSRSRGYELAWFASTSRYFALAVHSPVDPPAGRLTLDSVADVRLQPVAPGSSGPALLSTWLHSPPCTVAPGERCSFDMGVYAGPLDRRILGGEQPMASLRMQGLILYQMSAMCAFCTFQWLAVVLLKFLAAVHVVVADWGVAIILLVVVVRAILHPLTRRAQINMQRFSKAMSDLKPEIDRLQQKFPGDPKKLQQEQLRLMRERGVNPLQVIGCLPMFLQMPIWIALYAMLYFAFELRHEPAFWGVFQLFWGWPFLADLSAPDHCFGEFAQPIHFLFLNITGLNVLPILMSVVFFVQQKYMSPPPSPSMTREQIQQQKIMKVMMVVLFPVMLYSAPSGLTLYMVTSSLIGIVEGHYIRKHITQLDLAPPKPKEPGKPRDLMGRLYADALERAKKKRQAPPKSFKQRRK